MSKLNAFLKPVSIEVTDDIIVSDRFRDENGKPATMKIKAITQAENDRLIKLSTKVTKDKGQIYENLNRTMYQKRLVVACTVEPDFSSKEMCDAYGVVDPLDVPTSMLFSGEFAILVQKIMDINGFKDGEEIDEEAKN